MAQQKSNPPSYVGGSLAIPGKPNVSTWPTPNLDDRILVIRTDTRKASWEQPEQGDAYTGPNADKFEGFLFATLKSTDQLGWVDLYYLNERKNQDEYNYEVAFPYADRDYPQYTRTYVVLRTDDRTAEPTADDKDPIHKDLVLTDHKWIRLQDPTLDSIFIGIQRTYERLPGPVIITYDMNQYQQVVVQNTQEVITESIPSPDAVTEIDKVERTGTAKARVTTGVVDSVFPATKYEVGGEDPINPYRYRKFAVALPPFVAQQVVAGNVVIPVLGTGEFAATQAQLTDFKKQVATSSRDLTDKVPYSLVEYKITPEQQLSTITETLDTDPQSLVPAALVTDGELAELGNGSSILSKTTIPSVFGKADFTTEIPDAVPEKFKVLVPVISAALTSIGTAAPPTLLTGELSHRSEQQTTFWRRESTRYRDLGALPVTLLSYKLNAEQQLVTIAETFDTGIQSLVPSTLLTEGSVDNLGNDTSVLARSTIPSVFGRADFTTEIPDPVPEKFKVAVPVVSSALTSTGTASQPTLGTGDLSIRDEQQTTFWRRLSTRHRDLGALPVTLISYRMTPLKQLETILETLDTGIQTISPSSTTIEAAVDNLGNNTSLKTFGHVPSVLDTVEYEASRPSTVWPERFRALVPETTTSHRLAGTAAPPTLGTGEFKKSEKQVDAFIKDTEVSLRTIGAPPTLKGQEYDQTLDVVVPYVEQIVPAESLLGTNRVDITPQGDGTDLTKTFDITDVQAALDNYLLSFPSTVNIQLPDILRGLTGIIENSSGDGTFDETGFAAYSISGNGSASASLSVRGTGQASAAILPDVAIDIQQVWANNIPKTNYLFFMAIPFTAADVLAKLTSLLSEPVLAWPKWNPIAHTLTLTGQRLTLQCTASSQWQDGAGISDSGSSSEHAQSGGTGYSQEVGVTLRNIHIPPTIHDAIVIGGQTSDFAQIQADATAQASLLETISKTGSVSASIFPSSLDATPSDFSIPTSGLRMYEINAQPYRWGYAQVHAAVIDFADIQQAVDPTPPPVTTSVSTYFYFKMQFKSEEQFAGGVSAMFLNILDTSTSKCNLVYDYTNTKWILTTEVDTLEHPDVISLDVWVAIDILIQSDSGTNITGHLRIQGVEVGTVAFADGITLNSLYYGASGTITSRNKRQLGHLTVGDTGWGSNNIFDGYINGTKTPPYDTEVSGSDITIVNSHNLLVDNMGAEAFEIKDFGPIQY